MSHYQEYSRTRLGGTGAKRKKAHDKKLRFQGRLPVATKASGIEERKIVTGRGGIRKVKLKHADFVNVVSGKVMKKVKIKSVVETPDNRHHARQRIITKGAIIDTELGHVKITNRVGQDGVVNGILLQK